MLDLEAIKERDKARTQGEWHYDGQHFEITTPSRPSDAGGYWLIISECGPAPDQERKCPCDQFGHQFDANYAFIAHASVDVPTLVQEVERLREMLSALVAVPPGHRMRIAALQRSARALLGKKQHDA